MYLLEHANETDLFHGYVLIPLFFSSSTIQTTLLISPTVPVHPSLRQWSSTFFRAWPILKGVIVIRNQIFLYSLLH